MRAIALITLYNPTKWNIENVFKIANQTDLTIVCDNSPTNCKNEIENAHNIIYLNDGVNRGISNAFNLVLKNASFMWEDSDCIIFFDQDSLVSENHIQTLIHDFQLLKMNEYPVGCIGASFSNKNNQFKDKSEGEIESNIIDVRETITSSMMCEYKTLKQIGFWNESLFLDLADWDLCWRMREKGYQCFVTKNVVMFHVLGEGEKKIGSLRIKIGAPAREYYQTRDCLYLTKEKYVPFAVKMRFLAKVFVRPLIHVAFLDNKIERAFYILLGIRDFLNGKKGACRLG